MYHEHITDKATLKAVENLALDSVIESIKSPDELSEREFMLQGAWPFPLKVLGEVISRFEAEYPDQEVDGEIRAWTIGALYLMHMTRNQLEQNR